ncbi:hypothetical protein MUS1_06740 [Marinomonas ushuaiensis DSM 15871]|uniref:Bacteriophage T5 Orf172 DNA-binding domain-containing protein n=1 Tax=Marinomonas ushuaiensis DSM 15871 TaxID=1122207 RepID=X7E0X7_9GAMM|nr:DUF4041 domain-containing protein [Marinomonas ushuaiensis]ETX09617.1 hypothetical protein MUS1_06740 [Marinomonas ushuaiensis DSM 15871]
MLQELTPYQLTSLLLCLSTALIVFFIYSISQKRKKLSNEIGRRETLLESKSVNEIVSDLKQSYQDIEKKICAGKPTLDQLTEPLKHNSNQLKYIDVGLLPPTFKFDDREFLKEQISEHLEKQFKVINDGRATSAYSNWEWFGSKSKGSQMVNAYQGLLLKAFNAEFDVIRKQMRHSSFDTAIKKLYRLEEQLRSLGETANVSISHEYMNLKEQELRSWHSELEHKEEQKQEKKRQQALLREQAKQLGGDTEELEDDIYFRKSDLNKAQKIAQQMYGASAADMELKISLMQKEIERLETKFERATSQAQLTKAGYIYVISNIGSFGEGVVKIGMTRRLEPMDRVNELGDASVPFKFDVHTLTFVDDAPKIEKILHRKFDDRRVNDDNYRKEFFKVTPQQVSAAMDELGIECDWYFDVEAKEYRESLLIREALKQESSHAQTISSKLPESI